MNKLWFAIIGLSAFALGHVVADIQCDRQIKQILACRKTIADAVQNLNNAEKDLEQYKRWRAQEFNMDYLGRGRYRMNGQ